MSDFLSQDDIDALLQAGDFGASSGGEEDAFSLIVDDFNEQQNVAIKTLVGRSIDISIDEVIEGGGDLSARLSGEYLSVEIELGGGVAGNLTVHGSKTDFARLADLMVMGDGTASYNSEEHDDAVKEMYSSIAGNYSTFLGGGDKVGVSVQSKGVSVYADMALENIVGKSAYLGVTIDGFDTFPLIISFDEKLFHELNSAYGGDEPAPSTGGGNTLSSEGFLSQEEMNSLTSAADEMYSAPAPRQTPSGGGFSSTVPKVNIDMLLDVELDISIELGRADVSIKRILDFAPGSLVELDSYAGEPVNLLVNNKIVAKGEVVVVDENFGVRIISLVSPEERIKSLR